MRIAAWDLLLADAGMGFVGCLWLRSVERTVPVVSCTAAEVYALEREKDSG